MKLLIITAVKDYEKETLKLFKKARINAWSNLDINGFKTADTENLIGNWFSSAAGNVNSVMFFTFTDAQKIDALLEEVKSFNDDGDGYNPIRAIVLDIEKSV
ncbi:MAG: hypothetical protein ABFR05_09945 [Bacteroidota bacterium]